MERVLIKECKTYQLQEVSQSVEYLLGRMGGIEKLVSPGQIVAIKPNIIVRKKPEGAATTHPALVEAVVRSVIQAGGKPVICDSPGGPYNKGLLKMVYNATGMTEVANKTGAQLNYDTGEEIMQHPGGERYKSFPVIKPLARADVIIGLPKLKTHGMTTFTGAVKLFYGSLPGLTKAQYHFNLQKLEDFSHLLIDLVSRLKPVISIMDGIWGMEGDGPISGSPRFAGVILAGVNPFAVDAVACKMIGIDPEKIKHLKLAVNRGLVEDFNVIKTEGDGIPEITPPFKLPGHKNVDFNLPPFAKNMLGRWFQPKPVFSAEMCAGCGDCARACPAGAIEIKDKKARVNIDQCIRCFCCHEMCLPKAISVHQWWLAKKLLR